MGPDRGRARSSSDRAASAPRRNYNFDDAFRPRPWRGVEHDDGRRVERRGGPFGVRAAARVRPNPIPARHGSRSGFEPDHRRCRGALGSEGPVRRAPVGAVPPLARATGSRVWRRSARDRSRGLYQRIGHKPTHAFGCLATCRLPKDRSLRGRPFGARADGAHHATHTTGPEGYTDGPAKQPFRQLCSVGMAFIVGRSEHRAGSLSDPIGPIPPRPAPASAENAKPTYNDATAEFYTANERAKQPIID